MPFPGVTVDQAEAGKAAVAGPSFLSGASALVNPIAAGLSVAGGLSSMFGGGGSGMDVSKAVSGGTFMTGDISTGKSGATILIMAGIVLGLFLIFRKK